MQLLQLRHGASVAGLRTPRTLDALPVGRDLGEFLDAYLRATRRARAVVGRTFD